MISYAMICGIPAMTAVSIYSVEGLSGLGGRLLFGVLADRLGAKPVLIGGLLVQALAIASYLVVNKLGQFYALSIVFGTAYGGVMPLYAVLAREYFGPASWERCSAPRPWCPVWAWPLDPGPAA